MRKSVCSVIAVVCVGACAGAAVAASSQMRAALDLEKQEHAQAQAQAVADRPSVQYTAANYRDPFDTLITQQADNSPVVSADVQVSPPVLTVQGVVWGGSVPQAIVENQVVKVGDTIRDVQIKEITKNGITFVYMEREFTISSPALSGSDQKAQP